MKKLLGIHSGRKNGNSEIVLKAALAAAAEMGAKVKMINLREYNILPCSGCEACTMNMTGKKIAPRCVYKDKDDMDKIMQEFIHTDGVILAAPVYYMQPCATHMNFVNRFMAYGTTLLKVAGVIDEIPKRVGAAIAVGGSTRSWMSTSLETMVSPMNMQVIKVVDALLATRMTRPGQAVTRTEVMEKARKLGQNVAKAMMTPHDEVKWLGDEKQGWCPICHSNSLMLGEPHWNREAFNIECTCCGAGGDLEKGEDGKWKFVVSEDGISKCRTITPAARADHFYEIGATHKEFNDVKDQFEDELKKYKEMKFDTI